MRLTRGDFTRIRSPWLAAGGITLGFLAIVTLQLRPPDPESRLPGSQRLPALISRQQSEISEQRDQVDALRARLQEERDSSVDQEAGLVEQSAEVQAASRIAGLVPVRGTGFTVSLADSTLTESPSGNVNDLVIHSQDVQAVVNAMWASGAEAISINGERLVGTSAILCVGNTLLLNGTVHAPPYEITAIGASREGVTSDPQVRRLTQAAEDFSLRYSVGRPTTVTVPAYSGSVALRYAQAVPAES